jgi:hypothetical protein
LTVVDLIAGAYLKATGSVSTLTSTDDDWTKLLTIANYYQQNWANEVGVDWKSLYSPKVSCGTVTATDTFSLDSTIHKISQQQEDPIRIVWSNGTSYTDYTLVAPDRLKVEYNDGAYVAQNGSSLLFNKAFVPTDNEFGGTIYVPAYTLPATLSVGTDVVSVDIPEWLVTICAAEYVRNDLVRQNQYPNLLAEANELMKKMVENNGAQLETVAMKRVAIARTW